ncbi:L-carnitine dehydrogenase [Alicyclobacillus dauci]|uniref:L-carnitine dehydrogenase n=1 Tax=Alicyclobacillus dauci TaxID=1475485 RepID=A0ABY6Z4F4_9BACL|nr:L-carnitine dehydrogenase [Alicyclobacillus dauci]WAH37076.1 L-carnitine dehydrogenase [Alicyclobacillus dauci]
MKKATNLNVQAEETHQVRKIAVVGTGVIGSGWIARCLANGYDVVATDPATGAEQRLRASVEQAWTSLTKVGLAEGASLRRLRFDPDLASAVSDADFIQENAPEREDLKRKLLAKIDKSAKPNAIIASSTSGITPSTLQSDCGRPERVLVGHPFNPVYLLPLVEIVPGEATDVAIVERASAFYQSIGMQSLLVRKEIEGHIADRLMEALWREALHIVNDGVATTAEVDAAIVYGAGLRWALMGPFLTFHLAGGEQGMRHMLEQFGPTLKLPWTRLEAPKLTDALREEIIAGCEAQSEGHSIEQLEIRRDDFLVRLLALLKPYWPAANLDGRM